MQQHATRRIIHAFISYGNIFFFGIVYETMAGSSTIIIAVIMIIVMVVSSVSAGGFLFLDPFGFFAPPKKAKNTVVEKDTKKDDRDYKNTNYLFDGESGDKLGIPETMRGDTDENCVYFYHIPKNIKSGIEWNESVIPHVAERGYWCLNDNKDVDFWETHNAIQTEDLKGTPIKKNRVNFAKIGKNVRLHVWGDDTDTFPARGEGNDHSTIEGSEYGTNKIFDFRTSSIGPFNLDAFQIAKKGESFKNI